MKTRDVFLCHASENKLEVLRPLVSALQQTDVTFWYDEAEIHWGDSVTAKVNEGLRLSRYVLVVFSEAFMEKSWPQRELDAALNIEASTGEVRVLPLLVGSSEQQKAILAAYPILNDKAFQRWQSDPFPIVEALRTRLGRVAATHSSENVTRRAANRSIPMPEVRRQFTQRDKDQYLRKSFESIKVYLESATKELNSHHPDVEAELEGIHRYKFVCSIYRRGEIVNRCKIWIGGPFGRDSISYVDGRHIDIDKDNSCSDWLTVEEGGADLGLQRSQMGFTFGRARDFDSILSAEGAAEYLWLRAMDPLAYA